MAQLLKQSALKSQQQQVQQMQQSPQLAAKQLTPQQLQYQQYQARQQASQGQPHWPKKANSRAQASSHKLVPMPPAGGSSAAGPLTIGMSEPPLPSKNKHTQEMKAGAKVGGKLPPMAGRLTDPPVAGLAARNTQANRNLGNQLAQSIGALKQGGQVNTTLLLQTILASKVAQGKGRF
eukprot:TRINITY_DN84606_c0_g1_i1.p1 TRINITY_DN84606_c0_g1~~TRINITY_DN84606_c0_g1_i1.p1  ORF type:complete len:178 (-),score=25.00 TRINITY_DN84606_c0_g1_i1:58-591(-)